MSLILHIETATPVCSVVLADHGKAIACRESNEPNMHSSSLASFVKEIFLEAGKEMKQLQAVAVSKGPGSYTGLRIGVSAAKGICYALDIPLISIGTLRSMAFAASRLYPSEYIFCPMIDARRMEVYNAVYDYSNNCIKEVAADIIDESSYSELLEKNKIIFLGDGAVKCKSVITHPSAQFDEQVYASAFNMIELALQKYEAGTFENTAYFEPFYLKDFVAGKPTVKGLQ